jgi:hypothetical protein
LPHDLPIFHLQQSQSNSGIALSLYYQKGNKTDADTGKYFFYFISRLFFFKKISPLAFLISALLWFGMMIAFWFVLPTLIYKRSATFRDTFKAELGSSEFSIRNDAGGRSWPWASFSTFMESPHFFHLYFDSRSFFIVPKDAFEGDEVHAARKILAEKIKR